MGGALVHLLGLYPGGGGHVPAVIRLDPLRDGRRRPAHVSGVRVRGTGVHLQPRRVVGADCVQRPRYLGGTGTGGRRAGALAPRPRSGCSGGSTTWQRSVAARHALRRIDDGDVPDAIDTSDAWIALRVSVTAARGDGHLHAPLSAVRQVLPHLSAAGATGRRILSRGWRRERTGLLRALRRRLRVAHARRGSQADRA